jgi:AraC-like DNA-binding protein
MWQSVRRTADDLLALSCQCLSKLRHSRLGSVPEPVPRSVPGTDPGTDCGTDCRTDSRRASRRPDGSVLVRTYPLTLPRDHTNARHSHIWDQLTYAASGVIEIDTDHESWIVPPHRAVWVPAGIAHVERMYAPVSVRMLYLAEGLATSLPRACQMVNVSRLLRELILHISRIGALDSRTRAHANLIGVVLDQLAVLRDVPLQLPMPRDPRALRLASLLRAAPERRTSLLPLARQAGGSRRTLERVFVRETHMTIAEWRRRARLLHAIRRLAEGATVTDVALEAGYSSVSAFVAVFRKTFATTPGRARAGPI